MSIILAGVLSRNARQPEIPSLNTLVRYSNSITTLEAVAKTIKVSFVYVETDR